MIFTRFSSIAVGNFVSIGTPVGVLGCVGVWLDVVEGGNMVVVGDDIDIASLAVVAPTLSVVWDGVIVLARDGIDADNVCCRDEIVAVASRDEDGSCIAADVADVVCCTEEAPTDVDTDAVVVGLIV